MLKKAVHKVLSLLKINPDIFRRFFFRKRSNNKNDIAMPVVFVIVIASSTSIISLSTFELHSYKQRINKFVSNRWNKIYDLYLGDADKEGVKQYLDSLKQKGFLNYRVGFQEYPKMVTLRSRTKKLDNIQAYAFSGKFDEIKKSVDIQNVDEKPYIFLDTALMNRLNVEENDIIFLKVSNIGGRYRQALRVKPIDKPTRIKCFFFDNYLGFSSKCKLRYNYDELEEGFNFLFKDLIGENRIPTPINFGYGDELFGTIKRKKDPLSDFVLPVSYVQSKYNLNIPDSLGLTIKHSGGKSERYNKNIDLNHPIKIDYHQMDRMLTFDSEYTLELQNFKTESDQSNFFIELDMIDNFSYKKIRNNRTLLEKQTGLLDYSNRSDTVTIVSHTDDFQKNDTYLFMNYNKLDSVSLSKEILAKLNYKNVRWDTGRWTTIINLNESLKKGRKNVRILILVNLLIFLIFLNIKFLLRLKLEFHTIGVLKCFGFANLDIYKVYIFGYLIHVFIGLILGIFPFSYITGLLAGHELSLINYALMDSLVHPFNFLTGYGAVLLVSTFVAVAINLNRLVKKSNIYELIKYEG